MYDSVINNRSSLKPVVLKKRVRALCAFHSTSDDGGVEAAPQRGAPDSPVVVVT